MDYDISYCDETIPDNKFGLDLDWTYCDIKGRQKEIFLRSFMVDINGEYRNFETIINESNLHQRTRIRTMINSLEYCIEVYVYGELVTISSTGIEYNSPKLNFEEFFSALRQWPKTKSSRKI
jgi:hypothetical protein